MTTKTEVRVGQVWQDADGWQFEIRTLRDYKVAVIMLHGPIVGASLHYTKAFIRRKWTLIKDA